MFGFLKKKAKVIEQTPMKPEVEFFNEISERYTYWANRSEPEAANFAAAYKNIMHELTRETD